MSDDPKGNPPAKLTLSRDLKTEPEAATSPPAMKLKRKEERPEPAPPTDTKEPEAISNSSPTSTPTTSDAPAKKSGFDPKDPFGDVIKGGQIKAPSSPPPELPSKPAPRIDDGSGAKVEDAIDSLNSEEEAVAAKSSILPSVVVILILLVVLGGAGFGLWKVLQTTSDSDSTEEATASDEAALSGEASPSTPIQKAKAAIAQVPVADVDAIISESPTPESTAAISEVATPTEEAPAAAIAPAASGSVEATKQSVSQYLSGIRIGGIRKGERPMVMIEGETFQVGDVVQAETNLKFDGLRDGRLAFRDQNGIVYLKSF